MADPRLLDALGKELSYKELLPNLRNLKLRSVLQTKEGWLVEAGGSGRAVCPRCGVASRSRRSRYWRRLKDLPLQGASVTIKLQLGRWRCRNRKCERKIFTERVAGVLVPHAQQTVRLGEIRMLVGRGLGGRPGERLMSRLGMAASRHTLLRQVIRAARGCALTDVIRVVGEGADAERLELISRRSSELKRQIAMKYTPWDAPCFCGRRAKFKRCHGQPGKPDQ